MIGLYLNLKNLWSRVNDYFVQSQGRAPLPQYNNVLDFCTYLFDKYKYRSDPLFGAADFVTHPERFQWALLNPDKAGHVSTDCDDLAAYAYAVLKTIPGVVPKMYTLFDSSGKFGHHVVCSFALTVSGRTSYGVIDTNGLAWLPNGDTKHLLTRFNNVYKDLAFNFTEAYPTEYPF